MFLPYFILLVAMRNSNSEDYLIITNVSNEETKKVIDIVNKNLNLNIYIDITDDKNVDILSLDKIITIIREKEHMNINCIIENSFGLSFYLTRICTKRRSYETSLIGISNFITHKQISSPWSSEEEIINEILISLFDFTCKSLGFNAKELKIKLPLVTTSFCEAFKNGFSDELIDE